MGYLYYRQKKKELASRDVKKLESQFREAIRGVDAAIKAGYSVENAFVQSGKDMERQFGKGSFICEELEIIRRGLVINITLEEMLGDLAVRSGSEAIEDFAKVFMIAKRFGGNLSEVIGTAVETISVRIETRDEILAAISGKKAEQNIMKIMPFGILAYVGISSPGYFDSLYGNLTGVAIMTGLLAVYLFACFLGDKILTGLEEAG
ncbi:MAG: type II secretion system F family protein [Lachnospiraceae bacterium]|nr:type II secretion system F family protein [Lachnospiraceae bacterium]